MGSDVTDGEFVDQAIRRGWIDFARAQECKRIQAKPGHDTSPIHEILLGKGYLSQAQVDEIFGRKPAAPPPASPPPPPVEEPLKALGPYTLIEKIGTGSMGSVYKARKEGDARELAVKVFFPGFSKIAPLVHRFKTESKTCIKLAHPNLCKSVEFGISQGRFFHATEFVYGATLARVVAEQGKLSEAEALKIAGEVATALDALFQSGVHHGDVKAENVMLGKDGVVRLMDVGEAKSVLCDPAACKDAGFRVGGGSLQAPEQILGKSDYRSDLFALGALLVHMLSGRAPKMGETPDPRVLRSELQEATTELIRSLLTHKPEERPATPGAVVTRTKELLAKSVPAASAPPRPRGPATRRVAPAATERRRKISRRDKQLVIVAATVALFVGGPLLIAVLYMAQKPPPAAPAPAGDPAVAVQPPAPVEPTPPPVAPPPEVAPKEEPLDKLFERVKASVVVISRNGQHAGTGFVVDAEGHIMTNYHVIRRAEKIGVKVQIDLPGNRTDVQEADDVRVVAADPKMDVAILKVAALQGKPRVSKIAHSLTPKTGEAVFAIGNPGLGGQVLSHTLTQGIISSDNREINGVTFLQTTAAVNPGNSGGPLFNMKGEVIGMVTLKAMFQENLGFALPMHHAYGVYRERDWKYKIEGPFKDWEAKHAPSEPDPEVPEEPRGSGERTRGTYDEAKRSYFNDTIGIRFEIPESWRVYTRSEDLPAMLQSLREADRPPVSEVSVAAVLMKRMMWLALITERGVEDLTARDYIDLMKQVQSRAYRGIRNESIVDRKFGDMDGVDWTFDLAQASGDVKFRVAVFVRGRYACRLVISGAAGLFDNSNEDVKRILDTIGLK